jgi:DNA-binding response OmpR family regulator
MLEKKDTAALFDERKRALIITDDTETAATLCGVFARCRFHVDTCGRLAEATSRALAEEYSLVALDLDSQSISPGEAVAILRRLVGDVPIMCLGSDASLDNERTVRNEGAAMVFEKPVDPDELRMTLNAMCRRAI